MHLLKVSKDRIIPLEGITTEKGNKLALFKDKHTNENYIVSVNLEDGVLISVYHTDDQNLKNKGE